jgi:hypothetical protein
MTIEAPNLLLIIVITPFIITGGLVKVLIEVSQPVRVATTGIIEQLTHLVLVRVRYLIRLLSVRLVSRLLLLLGLLRLFLFVLLACHVVV